MTEQLSVPVAELREICVRVLDHLATVEGDVVKLDVDLFWSIPPEELYNVYAAPHELTIGQLTESWGNLTGALMDGDSVNSFALVWVADVLRAIGQTVVR